MMALAAGCAEGHGDLVAGAAFVARSAKREPGECEQSCIVVERAVRAAAERGESFSEEGEGLWGDFEAEDVAFFGGALRRGGIVAGGLAGDQVFDLAEALAFGRA